MLFLGRYLQAIGGSATWVVGYAMLLDCTDTKNMGKNIGLSMTFIAAGVISGPAVSGVLLGLVGYRATWSVPMIILALDMLARLLMIDSRELPSKDPNETPSNKTTESNETTALFQNENENEASKQLADTEPSTPTASSPLAFYRIMLTDARILVALLDTIMFSSITAGFNNTLPLHLRDVFGWGSMETSLMFFCFQAPSLIFSTLNGMMRDRCGVRYPAAIGWALLAPLLWLLGVPGDKRFPWAGSDVGGKNIFIGTMIALGTVSMFLRGGGSFQFSSEYFL
jgi:MFS family permease